MEGQCELFYKYDSQLSWTQSQAACQSNNANLASVLDIGINNFVQNLLTSRSWIGGNKPSGSPAGSSWMWINNSTWAFENWNTGEPNDVGGIEDCLEMYSHNGKWNDGECSEIFSYVCGKHWAA